MNQPSSQLSHAGERQGSAQTLFTQ